MLAQLKSFTKGPIYLLLDGTLRVVAVNPSQALVIDWPQTEALTKATLAMSPEKFQELISLWGVPDLQVTVTDGQFIVPQWGLTLKTEPSDQLPYDLTTFLKVVLQPAKKSAKTCEVTVAQWRKINSWIELMKPRSLRLGTGRQFVVEDTEEGWKIITMGVK